MDEGWNARVFTGSANATRAAFHRNVEFLVELRGKKSRCGIDSLLGDSSDDGRPGTASLNDLLQSYTPSGEVVEGDRQVEEFERRVDRLATELAASAPVARCEPASPVGTFTLRLHSSRTSKKVCGEGLQLRARPVSLSKAHLYAVEPTQPCWVEFPAVSLLGLTAFFVFEAESTDQKLRRQFVLNVPLESAPENRHEAVLRNLLSNSDRVLRFLLLLLMDTGARDLSTLFGESSGNGAFGFMAGLPGMTLFESLVRALDREPERLDQMARIIDDLQRTPEGRELLPANLEVIWVPVWTARRQQIERKKREK